MIMIEDRGQKALRAEGEAISNPPLSAPPLIKGGGRISVRRR